MISVIKPTSIFQANLGLIPGIDTVAKINLFDAHGTLVDTIINQHGRKGSIAVYQYLQLAFETIDAEAAKHGLAVFAEHVADANARPGVHPNVERLIAIAVGGPAIHIEVVKSSD